MPSISGSMGLMPRFSIKALFCLTALVAALVFVFRELGPIFVLYYVCALCLAALTWCMYRDLGPEREILPDQSRQEKQAD